MMRGLESSTAGSLPALLQHVQSNQLSHIYQELEEAPSLSMSEYADHLNEYKKMQLSQQTSANMPNVHEKPGDLELELFHCIRHNLYENIVLLLEEHVHNLNLNARVGKGSSMLHVACMNGNLSIARLLLSDPYNVDVNARTSNGSTPLHWAAGNGHHDIVELLLKKNADPSLLSSTWCVDVFGKDSGQLPLHWAVASGHEKCAELLLQAFPQGTGLVDERLNTPLELAKKDNHVKTMDLLNQHLKEEYVVLNVQEVQYDISKLW